MGEESGGGTDGVDEDVVAPAEAFDTFSPTNLCKYTGWDFQVGERVSESQNGYQSTSYLKALVVFTRSTSNRAKADP